MRRSKFSEPRIQIATSLRREDWLRICKVQELSHKNKSWILADLLDKVLANHVFEHEKDTSAKG